jgi:hypothetical protein
VLDNVVANYLDNLEEREFDAPFMALLRATGFREIHLLHGPFEFGKDFIAQNTDAGLPCQFAFQTKAGDIGLADWNVCRGQIDLLRTNSLAHPAFDTQLPRRAVFVTTGRLVGGAALAAQEYSRFLGQNGETGFTTWDKEKLVELISRSPEIGLSGHSNGPLLSIVGAIDQGVVTDSELERFSRTWVTPDEPFSLHRSALEAAIVCNRLRRSERLDLGCYVALCLVRAAWASAHGPIPGTAEATMVAEAGRSLFKHYAGDLFARCDEEVLDASKLICSYEPPSAHVTYPVRCLRLVELLGLLGFLQFEEQGHPDESLTRFLSRFFLVHPGAAHPLSDRWAVSLVAPILLLANSQLSEVIRSVLTETVRWIGDRYETRASGLAGPTSTPDEEISYLLGGPFEHVNVERRMESYVATVVLDLAAVLEMGDVFELARNDFLAVAANPCVVEVKDTPGQYTIDATDLTFEANMTYAETWLPQDRWKVAPHHTRGPDSYYLQRIGRPWDHLAISSVLRDRHFVSTCRGFVEKGQRAS